MKLLSFNILFYSKAGVLLQAPLVWEPKTTPESFELFYKEVTDRQG